MRIKHLAVGLVACAALLVAAPTGLAQPAGQSGYSEPAGTIQQQLSQDEPRANARVASDPGASSALPFTGLDLGLVVGAGGILLAFGLAARRLVS